MTKVKNLKGTSDRRPPGYLTWKSWWEAKQGRKFSYCSVDGCNSKAEVGGHVKKVYGGNEWYITPLCSACNNRIDEFNVSDYSLEPVR